MTTVANLLRRSADAALPVLRGIGDNQLDLPTPCAEYRVGALIDHLFLVVVNFQGLARREPVDFSATPDVLGTPWRDRFATEAEALVGAWSEPSALDGVSPGMGLPQPVVGQMALLDLTLHPWDLAVATGQPYQPDPGAVAQLHELVDLMGDRARQMKVLGAEVPVAADAGPFERLLGRAGRDPDWTAAA
ncbi:TIGR03086 family metal-binding protein [Catellatospora sp. KI3]|uniref:TIGR03086 family metal-binding protein n=1 Tax=Catellatospora sp. KI3 TaxID=3041620 RepID=UPI002482EDD2|nr:TIGR03086 family metal-binding protein [Catellatospora sp. KI3]MDI1464073.1 TIGR03086 family metal-binding protein [Catellatospora sp. KI3]